MLLSRLTQCFLIQTFLYSFIPWRYLTLIRASYHIGQLKYVCIFNREFSVHPWIIMRFLFLLDDSVNTAGECSSFQDDGDDECKIVSVQTRWVLTWGSTHTTREFKSYHIITYICRVHNMWLGRCLPSLKGLLKLCNIRTIWSFC